MSDRSLYARLAQLFEYPGPGYAQMAEDCLPLLREAPAEAAATFEEFCAGIRSLRTQDLQELFTRTFDLNPVCTLEVGWHLFGEDYQRGEFLVKMRGQLRRRGVAETSELPDHLTHALALLARMEDDEAAEFAGRFLLPALDKMLTAWRENRNAYASLLESLFVLLKSRFPYERVPMPVPHSELTVLQ
jgi:nitrate reductase delta subunit